MYGLIRSISAASLLFITFKALLHSSGCRGSAKVYSSIAISICWGCNTCHFLHYKLLCDLCEKFVNSGTILRGSFLENSFETLRLALTSLCLNLVPIDPVCLGGHDSDNDVLIVGLAA